MFFFHYRYAIIIGFLYTIFAGYFYLIPHHYPRPGLPGKDVIWEPSSIIMTKTMINMANVTSADYVIDLGSGDGRLVIEAAKRGAKALGVEYNPKLIEIAKLAAKRDNVEDKAKFVRGDIFEFDFSEATVVTMFLLPNLNLKLRPKLLDMKPGTRIVSNHWAMGDWVADDTRILSRKENGYLGTAYFWVVPAKIRGLWQSENFMLHLNQTYQMLRGTITTNSDRKEIAGYLEGNNIFLETTDSKYEGTAGDKIILLVDEDGHTLQFVRLTETF